MEQGVKELRGLYTVQFIATHVQSISIQSSEVLYFLYIIRTLIHGPQLYIYIYIQHALYS